MTDLLKTPLHSSSVSRGAKMVEFAGHEMPVSFPEGVLKEHLHTRAKAGLFDVSHMGQVVLKAKSSTTTRTGPKMPMCNHKEAEPGPPL